MQTSGGTAHIRSKSAHPFAHLETTVQVRHVSSMSYFAATLIEHARDHGGVVTRSEALALGVPSTTLSRMVRQGILYRSGAGAYSLPGFDDQHLVPLHTACRKLGAVASHQSAAQIHRIDRPQWVKPTVSVARRRTKDFAGVTVHQLTDLTDDHITVVRTLPITTPERTIIDLAAVSSEWNLERIVDNALAARTIDLGRLHELFSEVGRQGKPGTRVLRTILDARSPGYVAPESELERRLIALIADNYLPDPARQFSPDWLAPTNGRVDLAYPEAKLIIEGDSRRWHTMLNSFESDRLRDNAAHLAGWTILRFTWNEIVNGPERVVSDIESALKMS